MFYHDKKEALSRKISYINDLPYVFGSESFRR